MTRENNAFITSVWRAAALGAAALLGPVLLPSAAQTPEANYDEAKVPKYTLPDPLTLKSGERVREVRPRNERRRPEILEQ